MNNIYRGRIAPSPTGYLHVGHALTFWRAQQRARAAGGDLILRVEDLDSARCRPEFRAAVMEDLRWFGLRWKEGPDAGGAFGPYVQSERQALYVDALTKMRAAGLVYPCHCSRRDIAGAALAPHDENEEPIYPGTCRSLHSSATIAPADSIDQEITWRFFVPNEEVLEFTDLRLGKQRAVAGRDFGDFIVWRKDDVPAYQLAVAVDDAAMRITEVVRGEDLLTSTFRQLLIYRALGSEPPAFYHTALVTDEKGIRLAKRNASLSLRVLRESGVSPEQIRAMYGRNSG
jgi:glutamyl/glutaminyl-tRNA synthetase